MRRERRPAVAAALKVVSADQIDSLLDFPGLIDRLRWAFMGEVLAPARHHHAIGPSSEAVHLLMPAWTRKAPGAGAFVGTKIVNVFSANGRLGLPAVLGSYLLQSGETGASLAIMDGTRLTHWRTAAASGLAAMFLARSDSRTLLMVGAGALAPFLVRVHAAVRPIERVLVWNHRRAGAESLVSALRDSGVDAVVADDLEPAVRAADVISCATLATSPIVRGAWLRPGQHLDLVGGFTLGMREADDDALRKSRIFVDTADALQEGGDVAIALKAGAIERSAVQGTLFDLCQNRTFGRRDESELTLFKATGTAIEDLAAAMLVWDRLNALDRSSPSEGH